MSFKPSASDTISLSWEDEELFPEEDDTAQSNSTPAGPPHTAAGTASAQPAPNRCGTAVWKDSSREAVANCRETADGERGHARGPAIVPETPRSSIWTERVLAHLKRSKQVRSSVSAATMAKPPPVVTGPPTPIQNPLPRLPRVDKKGVTSIFTKIAENSIQPKLHATPAPRPAHRPMYRASLRQANPPPNPSHPTVPLRVAQSTGTAPPRQDNIMVPLYIPANLVNSVLECLAGQAQPTMPFPRTEACIPVEIIRHSSENLRTPPVASPFAAGRSSAIHSTPKAHSEQTDAAQAAVVGQRSWPEASFNAGPPRQYKPTWQSKPQAQPEPVLPHAGASPSAVVGGESKLVAESCAAASQPCKPAPRYNPRTQPEQTAIKQQMAVVGEKSGAAAMCDAGATQECRPASMKRRLSAQPPPSMAKRRVVTGGCEATGQSLQSTPANTPPGLKQVLHAPSAVALKQRKAQAGGSPSGAAAVSRSPGVLCKRPVSTTQKPQLAWVTPEKLAARAARFGISLES